MTDRTALLTARWTAIALFIGLLASIIWAGTDKSIGDGFAVVMGDPWGVVTLLDLYIGLAFVGLWIYALERRLGSALFWGIALALLGNLATLTYLVLRSHQVHTFRDLFLPAQAPAAERTSQSQSAG